MEEKSNGAVLKELKKLNKFFESLSVTEKGRLRTAAWGTGHDIVAMKNSLEEIKVLLKELIHAVKSQSARKTLEAIHEQKASKPITA